DAPAECVDDSLMSQADAEHGSRSSQPHDRFPADAEISRILRIARAGRDDDPISPQRLELVERDAVVAKHQRPLVQLAQVLEQVERKRGAVVGDHGLHRASRRSSVIADDWLAFRLRRAAIMARALSCVSRYSATGSESATIAPPTLKY